MIEQGLVYLHNYPWTTKLDRGLKQFGSANISKELISVNCSLQIYLHCQLHHRLGAA